MKRLRTAMLLLASFALLTGLIVGGCWFDVLHRHSGYADFRWTIDGSRSSEACALRGAERVQIHVFDAAGHLAASASARCDDFADSLLLADDWYHADLNLVDAAGRSVANEVTTPLFHVPRYDTVVVDVAFHEVPFLETQLSSRTDER